MKIEMTYQNLRTRGKDVEGCMVSVSDRVVTRGYPSKISLLYTNKELAQLRDGITTYLNSLPKEHAHADAMAEYAKDAKITDRPWELWEVNWNVDSPKWSTLVGNPKWCPDYEYRRKLNAMG